MLTRHICIVKAKQMVHVILLKAKAKLKTLKSKIHYLQFKTNK